MNNHHRLFKSLMTVMLCAIPLTAAAELPCDKYKTPEGANNVDLTRWCLRETSGMVVSRSNPDYIWAHNDSWGDSQLFLINRKGNVVKTFHPKLTANVDWEDIAIGPCTPWGEKNCIYLADTGDNLFERYDKRIIMIEEPNLSSLKNIPDNTELQVFRTWHIQYPETGLDASSGDPEILKFVNPDAESIMVRPGSAEVYIISKQSTGGEQTLFKMTRGGENAGKLTALASYEFKSGLGMLVPLLNATTGADFHPNGYRFAIRTYASIFEYDLTEYPDIAEAFQHPIERFDSFPTEIQGEAIAYDIHKNHKNDLITGAEGRDGSVGKMHFYQCVKNTNYVEPDPIQPPDPIPESDPEPDPEIGCPDVSLHVANHNISFHVADQYDRCDYDTIYDCNATGYACSDHVEHWSDGVCWYNKCLVTVCSADSDTHILDNGRDINTDPEYESQCEPNSVENCGWHGHSCAESVEHWTDGTCTNGQCVVTACSDEFHPQDNACVADDTDNCGQAGQNCADQIDHWTDGQCIEQNCVVSACTDGYHVYENACEEDSVEHCGTHDNDCTQSIEGWSDGTCVEKQCTVTSCTDPQIVNNNACVDPAQDDPGKTDPDDPNVEPTPEQPTVDPDTDPNGNPEPDNPLIDNSYKSRIVRATSNDCSAAPLQPANPMPAAILAILGCLALAVRRHRSK